MVQQDERVTLVRVDERGGETVVGHERAEQCDLAVLSALLRGGWRRGVRLDVETSRCPSSAAEC